MAAGRVLCKAAGLSVQLLLLTAWLLPTYIMRMPATMPLHIVRQDADNPTNTMCWLLTADSLWVLQKQMLLACFFLLGMGLLAFSAAAIQAADYFNEQYKVRNYAGNSSTAGSAAACDALHCITLCKACTRV